MLYKLVVLGLNQIVQAHLLKKKKKKKKKVKAQCASQLLLLQNKIMVDYIGI